MRKVEDMSTGTANGFWRSVIGVSCVEAAENKSILLM